MKNFILGGITFLSVGVAVFFAWQNYTLAKVVANHDLVLQQIVSLINSNQPEAKK